MTVVGGLVEVTVEKWVVVLVETWVETSVIVLVENPPLSETNAMTRTAPMISPAAKRPTPFAGPDALRCMATMPMQSDNLLIRPMEAKTWSRLGGPTDPMV